jgi:hypothetical protein
VLPIGTFKPQRPYLQTKLPKNKKCFLDGEVVERRYYTCPRRVEMPLLGIRSKKSNALELGALDGKM